MKPSRLSDLARVEPRSSDAQGARVQFAGGGCQRKQKAEPEHLPCRRDADVQHGEDEGVGERARNAVAAAAPKEAGTESGPQQTPPPNPQREPARSPPP